MATYQKQIKECDECLYRHPVTQNGLIVCTNYSRCLHQPKVQPEKLTEPLNTRNHNVGNSDYSKHKIQPWDIWKEYKLNPWDADVVKRILRTKEGDTRKLDYQKIIHICQERIRQLEEEE